MNFRYACQLKLMKQPDFRLKRVFLNMTEKNNKWLPGARKKTINRYHWV